MLASGSLYLSSPLPVERGDGLIKALESKVQELGQPSLRQSSVEVLLRALQDCNVNTMWIQEDGEFEDWENKPEQVEEVMIGDTEYEVGFFDLAVIASLLSNHFISSLLSGETGLRLSTG